MAEEGPQSVGLNQITVQTTITDPNSVSAKRAESGVTSPDTPGTKAKLDLPPSTPLGIHRFGSGFESNASTRSMCSTCQLSEMSVHIEPRRRTTRYLPEHYRKRKSLMTEQEAEQLRSLMQETELTTAIQRVPFFRKQVKLLLWMRKNLQFLRFVNEALHFSDKPPVLLCLKGMVLSLSDIDSTLVLYFFLVANTVKLIANVVKDTFQVPRPTWCLKMLQGAKAVQLSRYRDPETGAVVHVLSHRKTETGASQSLGDPVSRNVTSVEYLQMAQQKVKTEAPGKGNNKKKSVVAQGNNEARISERSFSCPSCHTVAVSSVTLIMALHFNSLPFWLLYIILSIAMALSRTALGMHWPFDTSMALLLCLTTVPPLYAAKDDMFLEIVKKSPEHCLFYLLGYSLLCSLIYLAVYRYCMMVVGVPSNIAHIADDFRLFKRVQIGTEIRDNMGFAGVAVGIYAHWKWTLEGSSKFEFKFGVTPCFVYVGGLYVLLCLGAWLRGSYLKLEPWSPRDYYVKWVVYFCCGFWMVAGNGVFWWVKNEKVWVDGKT